MKLVASGCIELTWKEWHTIVGPDPEIGLSWWRRLLMHPQHWWCRTFRGHIADMSMDEFMDGSAFLPFEVGHGPLPSGVGRSRPPLLSDDEISNILQMPPREPRPTKWSQP